MGIRREINNAIQGLYKSAFAPGYVPLTGDKAVDGWNNLIGTQVLRSVSRGIKEAVPGLIDGVIGNAAGALNGLGTGIGTKLSGGNFTDGFSEGFNASKDFVKDVYSDTARQIEMAAVGDRVKHMFDATLKYHDDEIKRNTPPEKYFEYIKGRAMVDAIGDGVASATELAITLPFYGRMASSALGAALETKKGLAAVQAIKKGLAAVQAAKSAQRFKSAYRPLRKVMKPLRKVMKPFGKGMKLIGNVAIGSYIPREAESKGRSAYNLKMLNSASELKKSNLALKNEILLKERQNDEEMKEIMNDRFGPTKARAIALERGVPEWLL